MIDTIRAFLGPQNVTALSLHRLATDRFGTARLRGKLANIHADLPSGMVKDISIFKQLTGFDPMTAEEKYKKSVEFTPYVRRIFSSNRLPKSWDDSEGYHQRWVIVPFENTFRGEQDEIARSELLSQLSTPEELSGALNKALDWLKVVRTKGTTVVPSMTRLEAEVRAVNDLLARWLDDYTETHPLAEIEKDRLYKSYLRHCGEQRISSLSKAEFGRSLMRLRSKVRSAQRWSGPDRKYVYEGIKIRAYKPGFAMSG